MKRQDEEEKQIDINKSYIKITIDLTATKLYIFKAFCFLVSLVTET